ncbi:hypothetical protein HN954_04110 [bacterium]|jgi:hypothetical protein|nr:hypothetical protein [bacterium]MBT6831760.1 hypothetical protein [bacterium]MBT6996583.1 hypothetical protein [bacterium]MBT7772909.1 hypothetical protein [bacterium]
MNQNKILIDALREFQKTVETAQKKFLDGVKSSLKQSIKDVEGISQKQESEILAGLESELDAL